MSSRATGQQFDDPEDLFHWAHDAIWLVSAINAVNSSGVTTRLLQGPADIDELAAVSGLPADKLVRLLDYLVGHEAIEKDAQGVFRATQRTANIDEAASLFETAVTSMSAGSRFVPALREGKTPFEHFYGEPVFDYFRKHPEDAAAFGAFMGYMTMRDMRFISAHHRFQPFATVADIGGSMGNLVLAILADYPGTRGILFDLPETVELARPRVAASALAERVELVGGSFFEAVPAADLYTLKQILHDWHDDECRQILGCIRAAINPGGRLAVIDHILPDEPAASEAQATDLAMMAWDTGRERRLADFEALFDASGFRLDRVSHNPNGHSVIEAVPV